MDGLDLGGKIIFKVKLDQEIKKVIIHNDELNYNELMLMIQRIFSDRIKPNDEFRIKYADDENDLITIANDSDVTVAIQTTKIIKITIFLAGKEEKEEEIKPNELVDELRHLRTSIDSFLNKFDRYLKLDSPKIVLNKSEEASQSHADDIKQSVSNTMISNDVHKEFDPLMKKVDLDVSNKFQPVQKNSRAETPDSIGSSEFTLSQKQQPAPVYQGPGSDTSAGQVNNNHYPHDSQHHQQQQQQQQYQAAQHQQYSQMGQQQLQPTGGYNMGQMRPNPQAPPIPFTQQQPPYQNVQQPGPNAAMDPSMQSQQAAQQQQQMYPPASQPQQYYNAQQQPPIAHQQAQSNPATIMGMSPVPGYPQQPQYPQPSNNPYSNKINPNASLVRPPSATLYQQGYK